MKTEVNSDNFLIAEFMGLDWNGYECLKRNYNANWSELMPVVARISKMDVYMELDLPITASITEVHEAVVNFIKWYNSQTTSNPEQS